MILVDVPVDTSRFLLSLRRQILAFWRSRGTVEISQLDDRLRADIQLAPIEEGPLTAPEAAAKAALLTWP